VKKAFARSKIKGVLVIVNFRGLSSAYRTPFEDQPVLFQELQERTRQILRESTSIPKEIQWKHVWLSTFSAGFGAVREILKTPEHFDRIDGLVAADSIYAGLQAESPKRIVNTTHMQHFQRFAALAVRKQRTFLLTHSAQQTPYASTTETADDLLQTLDIPRREVASSDSDWVLTSLARQGRFEVRGYAGIEGVDHLRHLWMLHVTWDRFAELAQSR
jgi:hypothetical protein